MSLLTQHDKRNETWFFDEIREVEIDPTGLCNLACSFCPRATFYPNTNNHMSLDTAKEIASQLRGIDFTGVVSITGKGEPTLHNEFEKLVEAFDGPWSLKINTNGKRFEKYQELILDKFDIVFFNCYEYSEEEYREKVLEFQDYHNVIVKWRPNNIQWFEDSPRYTNRAGSFPTNYQPEEKRCDVIFHKLFIDYNGVYRLCCEDWKDEISMGNIYNESILDYVEHNELLRKYRKSLVEGDRSNSPCNSCSYSVSDFKYKTTPDKMEQYKWLVEMENLGV